MANREKSGSDETTPVQLPAAETKVEAATPAAAPQPKLIKVVNTSRTTLTIKSQQSKIFPPGATEVVTEEEAERWRGLVAVLD